MDFKELIETGDGFAQIAFQYKGSREAGMLAWVDDTEMKAWWKADNVIIDPYPGGMFYITWAENDKINQYTIYGVMELIDDENHCIKISKIFFMAPGGKLGPLQLHIWLETAGEETKFCLRHTHNHRGQSQEFYQASVYASWPQTFSLLKNHLEKTRMVA